MRLWWQQRRRWRWRNRLRLQVVLLLQELTQLVYSNLQYAVSKSHEAALSKTTTTRQEHTSADLPVLVVIAHLMKLLFLLLVVLTLLRQTGAKHALVAYAGWH